jgi:TatA/E family protein of Tat protein translocase
MNIGPTEIILVLAIALLVFGPSRLPQMGRSLGRGLREFKNAANTAKEELGLSEVIDEVNQVKDDVTSAAGLDELKASFGEVTSTIDDVKQSAGVGEIAAGVGSAKAAPSFNPRKAAKDLVTGKKSSGARTKALEAAGSDAGTRELASPAAGEPAPDSVADDAVPPGGDVELVVVTPVAAEV